MNTKEDKIIGIVICIIAILGAGCVLFVPSLNSYLIEEGFEESQASTISGAFGVGCIFFGIIFITLGLFLINKWIPTAIVLYWNLSRSDSDEEEGDSWDY